MIVLTNGTLAVVHLGRAPARIDILQMHFSDGEVPAIESHAFRKHCRFRKMLLKLNYKKCSHPAAM